jgi:hypothetical protein
MPKSLLYSSVYPSLGVGYHSLAARVRTLEGPFVFDAESSIKALESSPRCGQPTQEVNAKFALNPKLFTGEYIAPAGFFDCQQHAVRRALSEFPAIEYHQGWIPDACRAFQKKSILLCTLTLISMVPFEVLSIISSLDWRKEA